MTQYNGGRQFEWETRTYLQQHGYLVVRSAGSKTKIDLIGIRPGQLVFIQCKRNGICSPAERVALLALAAMVGATPLIAARPRVTLYRLTGPGPGDRVAWTPPTEEAA